MRIVIAGGSGLIGRELTSLLAAAGDEVFILSRSPEKVNGLPIGSHALKWDGNTIQEWSRRIEECDVVVNLTGENLSGDGILPTRWSKKRKMRLVQSRVNSGKILTKAITISRNKPSVFVQASGINYYDVHQQTVLTEMDGPGSDFLAKLSQEWESSSQPVESMGIRRVIIRNGVVLSNKGGALRFMTLPHKFFVGGQLGNGSQIYSWIHIRDEVEAINYLIRNEEAYGAFNLTSPNPVTNREFEQKIAKVMKRPYYFSVPEFAMKLAFGEVASIVLEGQKVIPQRLMEFGYKFRYPLLEEALKDLFVSM